MLLCQTDFSGIISLHKVDMLTHSRINVMLEMTPIQKLHRPTQIRAWSVGALTNSVHGTPVAGVAFNFPKGPNEKQSDSDWLNDDWVQLLNGHLRLVPKAKSFFLVKKLKFIQMSIFIIYSYQ